MLLLVLLTSLPRNAMTLHWSDLALLTCISTLPVPGIIRKLIKNNYHLLGKI